MAVGKELNPDLPQFDDSCFTGKYVTGDINEAYLRNLEESGRGKSRNRAGQKTSLVPDVGGQGGSGYRVSGVLRFVVASSCVFRVWLVSLSTCW